MTFKHEITWDGVAIVFALITAVVFITRLQDKAEAAIELSNSLSVNQTKQVETFEAEQNIQDVHLARLDTAISLLEEIVAERTGKPVPTPMKP